MDFSFKDKFCKHFVSLRQFYNEVHVSFNIDRCLPSRTDKIKISLFHDEKLDVEKKKRSLDQFAKKCKLCKCSWQVPCEIVTYLSDFSYGSILFDRDYKYVTCFEFRRPSDETFVHNDITFD